jgi:hypothetical protein
MPKIKYQVVEKSFIDGIYIDPQDSGKWPEGSPPFVDLDDTIVPGLNLKPTCDKGKAQKAKLKEQNKIDAKNMHLAGDGHVQFAEA